MTINFLKKGINFNSCDIEEEKRIMKLKIFFNEDLQKKRHFIIQSSRKKEIIDERNELIENILNSSYLEKNIKNNITNILQRVSRKEE